MKIWTEEQVKNLKKRQETFTLHPYTCDCGENLIPTEEGWVCDKCSYTQYWAHGSDLDGEWEEWFGQTP